MPISSRLQPTVTPTASILRSEGLRPNRGRSYGNHFHRLEIVLRTYFVIEATQRNGGSLSRHFVAGGGSGRGWRTALRLWLEIALETRSFQRMRTATASAAPTRIHLPDPPARPAFAKATADRHDWRERESIQHASLRTSANLKGNRGRRTAHPDFHTTSMSAAHSFYPGERCATCDRNANGVASPVTDEIPTRMDRVT